MSIMVDDAPNVYAAVAVTLTVATVALALRLYCRSITKAGYWYDDGLAVMGWLGSLGYATSALVWAVYYGLGKLVEDGPQDLTITQRVEKAWLLLWCGSMTYTFAIAFCKFAILTFYWRVFQHSDIRIPIQVLSVITICWFILRLLIVSLQCIPIQARWDFSITDKNCGVKESTFFFSTVLTHVIIDFAILALPAIEIRRLSLPLGQKVAVIGLFTFGALTCIASVFVLIKSFKFESDTNEISLEMGVHTAWSAAETNLAVLSASLPMLRPVFQKILPHQWLTSYGDGDADNARSIDYMSRGLKLNHISTSQERITHASPLQRLESGIGPPSSDTGDSRWNHGSMTFITSALKMHPSKSTNDHEAGNRL